MISISRSDDVVRDGGTTAFAQLLISFTVVAIEQVSSESVVLEALSRCSFKYVSIGTNGNGDICIGACFLAFAAAFLGSQLL